MLQLMKPVKLGIFTLIIIIGVLALVAELTEYENIAKLVVVPSLVLLIAVSTYAMLKTRHD